MERNRTIRFSVVFALIVVALAACSGTGRVNQYNAAVEHYEKGRIPEAIEAYQNAARRDGADLRPKFNLAVIYQDQGRLEEAERLYRAILDRHPDYAPAWVNLASIRERAGDDKTAETYYRRACEINRDSASASAQYGFFLLKRERVEESQAAFEESLRRDSRFANAYFGLGLIAERRGDLKGALRAYENTLHYNGSDLEALLRAADIETTLGARPKAVRYLKRAADLDDKRGETFLALGRLLREEGMWKKAEEALEKAKALGASRYDCNLELRLVYEKLTEEASRDCEAEREELSAGNEKAGKSPVNP